MKRPDPKEVAIREINRRVVTTEEAKEEFLEWLKNGLKQGGFTDEIIDFWKEVKQEVAKL